VSREYQFYDADAAPIHHRFELVREGIELIIILKSGSGATRSDGLPHNSQYNQGAERLYSVLSRFQEPINKVVLDTRRTRALGLSLSERTLSMGYPILPWNFEPRDLRLKLGNLAQNIGQEPGARGGNNQKQLRIHIRDLNPGLDLGSIAQLLSGVQVIQPSEIRLPIGLPPNGETLFTRSNTPDGWLYVVSNPKWPDWVKIGITRNLSKRLSSYNTGAPTEDVYFKFDYHRFHDYAREIEREIHTDLIESPLRGDTSEWYRMSLEDAKAIIDDRCS
jgi:hypothetical protein